MKINALLHSIAVTNILLEADGPKGDGISTNELDKFIKPTDDTSDDATPSDTKTDDSSKYGIDDNTLNTPAADDAKEDPDATDPNDTKDPDASEEDTSSELDIPADETPVDANGIPDIQILNISETEKQLLNIKLLRSFKELYKNTDNSFNNITSITTKTPKQVQVIDTVANNLSNMREDIKNYMQYKFNDVYETNMTGYLTYLKRYKLAMELIHLVIDENSPDDKGTNNTK